MPLTTVADVAAMLRWGEGEKNKYQTQIAGYIAAASQVVEDEAGPFEAGERSITRDGASAILLPFRVNAIVSVTVNGSVTTAWTLDRDAAILYGPFASGRQNVVIVADVGYEPEDMPDAVKLAATMVTVDMWAIASQRAPGLDDRVDPAYLMPKTVRALLAPFKTPGGFA